ncbi:MAG: FliI/YscN family ATPase [Deltaproteobacteria bacterium]|nr:FliI/YscN family ATPase [Deltaproteobacteria bacterium]
MAELLRRVAQAEADPVRGTLRAVTGLALEVSLPGARVGDLLAVRRRAHEDLLAEVVSFREDRVVCLPYGTVEDLGPGDAVEPAPAAAGIPCSPGLLGRVLDPFGRPLDGGPPVRGALRPLRAAPPPALDRPRIDAALPTGVRALDALATFGVGQRLGLFAGSGVGKSTLLGQIARFAGADAIVVGLVGERGREVNDFLETCLGPEGRARSVVVVATSDEPALRRIRAARAATAVAEYFRDEGRSVLLLVDSVTRYARALREVALASGELPARRGYPPSVLADLPGLLERAGRTARGAVTGVYTVLVEGDDMDEPIADEVRGILDGHIVLDRGLAARGRWPAIDPLRSLSRVMPAVASAEHRRAAGLLRAAIERYEAKRELIQLGAHRPGAEPALDRVLAALPRIEAFLGQPPDERAEAHRTVADLMALAGGLT